MTLAEQVGDKWLLQYALINLGLQRFYEGHTRRAAALWTECVPLQQQLGHRRGTAGCLEGLGYVAVNRGKPERAARLLGAAEAWREATGAPLLPHWYPAHDRYVAAAREALGEAAFTRAWAAGRTGSLETAVDEALLDS